MRVLIVEDDAALGLFLQKGLALEGHEVRLETDGMAGLEAARQDGPELMVLDLSLPRLDGMEVLAALEGNLAGTSVLVLTGRNGVEHRVNCLDLGADDCLVKPFSFNELTARCRALMRRRGQMTDATLRHGEVELNRMERTVRCAGRPADLTVKEFALLEYLMQARGRCCSRSELLREVWQMNPDTSTNVVDVYINYLRKKLQGSGAAVIDTVRGEGYRMALGGVRKAVSVARPDGVAHGVPDGLQGALRGPAAGAFGLGVRANA